MIGIVVQLPFLARPVCLPVMARLWRPKQEQSKVDLAASMLRSSPPATTAGAAAS
ncbi:hypothetical protein [Streptomyces mirabilis]|uniref:hypothetical protein n=1 Tax=Streptomyces mirabilis TaxID=68239 RepID=UPI0033B70DAA